MHAGGPRCVRGVCAMRGGTLSRSRSDVWPAAKYAIKTRATTRARRSDGGKALIRLRLSAAKQSKTKRRGRGRERVKETAITLQLKAQKVLIEKRQRQIRDQRFLNLLAGGFIVKVQEWSTQGVQGGSCYQ